MKNNPLPDETGHTVVVGESGSGKTFMAVMTVSQSDVRELKQVNDAMGKLARPIYANSNYKFILKK